MKCFRCGYCCTTLIATIVIDPDREDVHAEENWRGINQAKERCPHLRGYKSGEYSCAIHNYPWFEKTPCGEYQSHNGDQPCRVGDFLTNGDWEVIDGIPVQRGSSGRSNEDDHRER